MSWEIIKENKDILQLIISIIAIIGSSYFASYRFQKEIQEKQRTSEIISTNYLENLNDVAASISEYGTATTLALLDIRIEISRNQNTSNEEIIIVLTKLLNHIQQRKSIKELINREYGDSYRNFPKLLSFDIKLYAAIKNTYYMYSRWIDDTMNPDILLMQLKESNSTASFIKSLDAVAMILQDTEIYLERRLRQINDYILSQEINTFTDFVNLRKSDKFITLSDEINDYNELRNNWMNSTESEERKKTSFEFSKWLKEHIEINPFEES